MNPFVSFMASPAGRITRIVAGIALIVWGLMGLTGVAGIIVAVIGALPLVAGVFDFCVFAPLFGAPLSGAKDPRWQINNLQQSPGAHMYVRSRSSVLIKSVLHSIKTKPLGIYNQWKYLLTSQAAHVWMLILAISASRPISPLQPAPHTFCCLSFIHWNLCRDIRAWFLQTAQPADRWSPNCATYSQRSTQRHGGQNRPGNSSTIHFS